MNKPKQSKLDWLVAARGYAMLGVFFGHVVMSLGREHGKYEQLLGLGRFIDLSVIPFFVLLTGAFYQRSGNGFWDYSKLKFGQRMLPVYLYLLLIIPFYFILPPYETAMDSLKFMPAYLLGIPWLSWPSWFLIALFMSELLFYFIFPYANSKKNIIILALLCWTLGWAFNYYKFNSPEAFMLGMVWMVHACLPFCALLLVGLLTRRTLLKMANWPSSKVLGLGFLAATICWFATEFNTFPRLPDGHFLSGFVPTDMLTTFAGQYGNYFYAMISILAGVTALICFCRLMPVNRFMRACGDYSLVLLGLNGIFQNIFNIHLTAWIAKYFDETLELAAMAMLLALISMAICLPIAMALDKYLPQLCGKPMLKGPILPALYRKT